MIFAFLFTITILALQLRMLYDYSQKLSFKSIVTKSYTPQRRKHSEKKRTMRAKYDVILCLINAYRRCKVIITNGMPHSIGIHFCCTTLYDSKESSLNFNKS